MTHWHAMLTFVDFVEGETKSQGSGEFDLRQEAIAFLEERLPHDVNCDSPHEQQAVVQFCAHIEGGNWGDERTRIIQQTQLFELSASIYECGGECTEYMHEVLEHVMNAAILRRSTSRLLAISHI